MATQAQALRSQIVNEHAALSELPAVVEAVWGGAVDVFSVDDWAWAQACCRSRAFPAPDGVHMALWPGIDHGNHASTAAFGSFYDRDTGESGLVAGVGMLPRADSDGVGAVPGASHCTAEVFFNYGKYLSNEQLLLFYGFVEPVHAASDWSVCSFPNVDGWPHRTSCSGARGHAQQSAATRSGSLASSAAATPALYCTLMVGGTEANDRPGQSDNSVARTLLTENLLEPGLHADGLLRRDRLPLQ